MTTPYTTGQIGLVNGSAMVTGIGTGWETALIIGGTIYVEADGGNALPILSIGGDTAITAAIAWTGPTGTYDYALVRDTSYGQQTVANAQALADYIQRLNNTALSAVAGVSPAAQTLLLFTGSDTATTIALSGLINGADYDVQVNNIAGRAVYDSRPANFRVLVADTGDGRSAIYSKNSNTAADWSAPAYITGPAGPDGVNPRGNYDPATEYVADDLVYSGGSTWIAKTATTGNAPPTLPTTENTQWSIFARAGSAGINQRGAYAAGTTYAALDVVLDNGSSWIAKVTTTGNTPPVLPTTENAYWSLLAAKGADGTGTGDVVGPASSVANRVAVFGGTSGKTIIDSGVILGNSASRNVGTTAGTVAAGDDARFSAGGQNDAILALEIADLKGARLGMKGGVADAFDDETGVDVKTNATYDDANDWYKPTVSGQANQIPAMTAATTGAVTMSASSIFDANYAAWKAGDRTTSTAWVTPGNVTTGWLQVDFGSAVTITSYTILPRASTPTQAPTNWAIKGSNDGSNFTTIATVTNYTNWVDGVSRSFDISSPGSYRYYRLDATSVGSGANSVAIGELTMLNSGVYANMTLVSVAYPLASVPTTARMTLQTVEFDAATPNTDFVAEFSRDGGTTWTAANLALSPYLVVGNYKMYEAQPFSVTAQPSGSSMKWRARTLTNKNIAMSGVVSQGS